MKYFRISILQLSLWILKLKYSKENRNSPSVIECLVFGNCFIIESIRVQFKYGNHTKFFKQERNQIKELYEIFERPGGLD